MNISSLPFYRSSQTVSRTSEPPQHHTRASSSREGNSRHLVSHLTGNGSSQSSRNELPHINSKRLVDWSWLDQPSKLPPPSSLRKRTGLGSKGGMRKQPYKMRGSGISEHIAMLKRKHLALERDQVAPSYEISSNYEETALQEVPASPPSVMGLTATSSLHEYFTEEQPPSEDEPSVAHTAVIHENKQSLPKDDIAYGFGLDNYSDIFEQNHEDYYDPLSALTEEDEQTWLFPAGEELPLPLSLESNDTDYEFSELAQSHQQQSDLDTPLPSTQESSPRYLQPLSPCSFNPSTFSIQNYYPREE